MQKTIDFSFDGTFYTVNVTPNKYFPTYESMVKVYLGVSGIQAGSSGVVMNVSLVKTVKLNLDFQKLSFIYTKRGI